MFRLSPVTPLARSIDNPRRVRLTDPLENSRDRILLRTEAELNEYFAGKRKTFSVKLSGASGVTSISSSTAAVTLYSHTADTTVNAQNSAPTFTASAPPATAMVGAPYDYTFAAGGIPAPSFAVTSGNLPPGLTEATITGATVTGQPFSSSQLILVPTSSFTR